MANFFPSPGAYFEDILRLDYIADIPLDNKETTGREDYFQPKKGDFDVVVEFTLYSGITSSLGGQSAREFFEERNKRILAVIEYGGYKRSGFIARETMQFNYTYPQHDSLRFTCIGIIGEFIDHLKTKSLPNYVNTATQFTTFNQFINNGLLDATNQTRVSINNQLDPIAKFGNQMYLSTPLYNDIRGRVSDIEQLNRWVFFSQICYTLGIKYDLECDFISPSSNGVITFALTLKWRTGNSSNRNLTLVEHKKGFRLPEQKEWVMIRDREWIGAFEVGNTRTELTLASGILYNKDTIYYNNAGYEDYNNLFVISIKLTKINTGEVVDSASGKIWKFVGVPGFYSFEELVDDIDKINFLTDSETERFSVGSFPPLVLQGVMILARVFVKSFNFTTGTPPFSASYYNDDTGSIFLYSTKDEYSFLLQSEDKETKTVKYDFPKGTEINLYDTVNHNDATYSIERLRADYVNEEIEADLIQI